jgi:DedD protein
MRTLFETEEEEVESRASEITLGTTSLLGIFFGLVLVCGVFFGFGYSLGRGTAWVSQSKSLDTPQSVKDDASPIASAPVPPPPANPVAAPAPPAVPPAASAQPQSAKTSDQTPVKKDAAPIESTHSLLADQDAPAKPTVLQKPAPGRVAQAYTAPEDSPALSSSGQTVVQIAAVTRPQDAYALITALKQHGYNATMRQDPQDNLLHVQVGPFADRNQASAMKQKLLADGYNAIIKQ